MIGFYETIALSMAGLTFVMMCIYIYCSNKTGVKAQFVVKSVTSLCFLLTGIICAATVAINLTTSSFLIIGMFLSVLGDIVLSLKGIMIRFHDRFVALGLFFFSLAHIAYIIAFFGLLPLSIPMLALGIGIDGIFISICLRAKFDFRNLYFAVIAFSLVISIMFAQTVFMSMFLEPTPYKYLILAGGIMFIASNIGIGIKYFKENSMRYLRIVDTGFYYMAQILFAVSMIFIP